MGQSRVIGHMSLRFPLKVVSTIALFEVIMLVTFAILVQFLSGGRSIIEILLNYERANEVVVIFITLSILAGYLTYLVVTRLFRPVSDLIRVTHEITQGNLNAHTEIKTGDQFELLSEHFNSMVSSMKQELDALGSRVQTRTKELEVTQKKEVKVSQEVARLRDELLFVAAHEFRTPVSAIRWNLESILAEKKLSRDMREKIQDALEASRELTTLVDNLLNMSQKTINRLEFEIEPVDLRAVVKDAVARVEKVAEDHGVQVATKVPKSFSGKALADERRLQEVLVNLLSNAVKYNDKKKGKAWVHLSSAGKIMKIEVGDDGPGMSLEEQKHIFDKFWRSNRVKHTEGRGLGLFITKRLVEGMDGKISFTSKVGKGTVFTLILNKAKQ